MGVNHPLVGIEESLKRLTSLSFREEGRSSCDDFDADNGLDATVWSV